MKTNLKGGLIKYNKIDKQIVLLYANDNESQFHHAVLANMKDAPLKDDHELVKAFYNHFKEGESRVEEYLKGFSYGLKSLLAGNTIDFAVDKENNKTHIALAALGKESEKMVKTYMVVDPFATLGNALLDYNVKRRQEEVVNLDTDR